MASAKARQGLKRMGNKSKGNSCSPPKISRSKNNESGATSKYFAEQSTSGSSKASADKAASDKPQAAARKPLTTGSKIAFSFYDVPCEQLAKDLLGKVLVTEKGGERIAGTIVETEAYLGLEDKAAHSYNGKRTAKTEAMFMQPGTAYVYNIYGMYCCLNISAKGEGAAVLLRAVEPKENLVAMNRLRTKGKGGDALMKNDGKGLCNGPSKICQAFNINKETFNKVDMCTSKGIWLEKGDKLEPSKIVTSKRININYAEEWVDKPLRFYVKDNKFVSIRDKEAEKLMDI